jgi:hypothetical protein
VVSPRLAFAHRASAALAENRTKILESVTDAKKALHRALGED